MAKDKKRQMPVRGWKPAKLAKAEKAALKRLEREEEIYAKAPEELTESEWKWLRDVMEKIHQDPRGRKKDPQYDGWMHKIARARLKGEKPPQLRDLAGIPRQQNRLYGEYDLAMRGMTDRFKKAKKQRQVPAPPKR